MGLNQSKMGGGANERQKPKSSNLGASKRIRNRWMLYNVSRFVGMFLIRCVDVWLLLVGRWWRCNLEYEQAFFVLFALLDALRRAWILDEPAISHWHVMSVMMIARNLLDMAGHGVGPCGCVRLIWLEIDVIHICMCDNVVDVSNKRRTCVGTNVWWWVWTVFIVRPFNFAAIERRRMTCMWHVVNVLCVCGLCVNRFTGGMCDCSDWYVSTQEFCECW